LLRTTAHSTWGFAVWHGDYYALETMQRLGVPDGTLRVGMVQAAGRGCFRGV
jgi:hypothetical protein